jgi:hypothetical protein
MDAVFKHPMNFEELRRPPCVGEDAYSDEEQAWCAATLAFLVDSLDAAGRLSRGVPETAVTRRGSSSRTGAAGPAASAAGPAASAAGPAAGGGAAAAAPRGRGRRRTEEGSIEASEDTQPNDATETDNDVPDSSRTKGRKRTKSASRYINFWVFSCFFG